MRKISLISGLALLVFVIIRSLWSVDRTGEIEQHAKTELILAHKIDSLNKALNLLSKANENLTLQYTLRGDSVKQLAKKAGKTTVIYRDARNVTDSDSTAENVAAELRVARVLIVDQESHINGLLSLNEQADSLLGLRMKIIQSQDSLLKVWPIRFANMIEQKDLEIEQERKRGNKKLGKGLIIGSILGLLIGVL